MSFLRNSYYQLKPYLPPRLRMTARRYLASGILAKSGARWPIRYGSQIPPRNWPGWPKDKKFAVVLTHDVESRKGLDRCLQLAEIEASFGFRSSFNFIPKGDYSAPVELRAELVRRGFEVGVHDLHHDGKLYQSRQNFRRHATQINEYLKSWNAVGFRSGFMHHKLDWLHDLDIAYDMSTFDTDPFEPQPDGVDTIFPFFVSAPAGPTSEVGSIASGFRTGSSGSNPECLTCKGYVELPYTLPQDSTVFLLLEERDNSLWKRKLDWVARHGGMALLNVHPDYINFHGRRTASEYPVSQYSDFLDYLHSNYGEEAWFTLPKEVAAHAVRFQPEKAKLSDKRVCMVSYSFYKSDNRVMRYAEALANRGDSVDVIALRKRGLSAFEVVGGVNLHRIQHRERNEKGKFDYLLRILRFLVFSALNVSCRHLRRRYNVLHVHNVPDFLVFSGWLPRLTGSRIILDIHDLLPEFFASKFASNLNSKWYVDRLLKIERASCRFADHVIISNHLWYEKITRRSVAPENCTAIVNHVDSEVFYPRARTRRNEKLIAIFPGGLQSHQGLDVAIRALVRVVQRFPTAEFHIYGEGDMKKEWLTLARELGLEKHVFFFKPLPLHEIADKIANADVGLVPKRADSFGNEAYSTKIMEFMSQGLPVVGSRTRIDTYYFNDSQIAFFESGNAEEMADQIVRVFSDRTYADQLTANGLAYVAQNNWNTKKDEYFDIVDGRAAIKNQHARPVSTAEPELIST